MRTIAESRADLWAELSDKHVYYILRKLEREGMVTVDVSTECAGPARRVFSVTERGLHEFDRMVSADALVESVPYSDFDIVFGMLAYTGRLTAEEKSSILLRRIDHLRAVMSDAAAAGDQAMKAGAPGLSGRVFEKVRRVAAAELGWLEEVLMDVAGEGWPTWDVARASKSVGEPV
jgi:DNA-binding PadR family transcriptional regulator